MPQRSLRAWTGLTGSFSPRPGQYVLDMGAGTGKFATTMARWLPVYAVVGIDPSVPMLAQARRAAHRGVHYVAGAAEAIPASGFTVTRLLSFARPVTSGLREYHARLATRPQSKFSYLTDAEFRDGLQHLAHDALAESPSHPAPVTERYDVLVLTAAWPLDQSPSAGNLGPWWICPMRVTVERPGWKGGQADETHRMGGGDRLGVCGCACGAGGQG